MPTFWVRSTQERRTSARRRPADGPRDASPATVQAERLVLGIQQNSTGRHQQGTHVPRARGNSANLI